MLGFRGCRLAIRYPEITEMQARAIFEAAVNAELGKPVMPEVMVPLIPYPYECDDLRDVIVKTAQAVAKETGARLDYQIGTMIELPRAGAEGGRDCRGGRRRPVLLVRDQRPHADVPGVSRDDAGRYSPTMSSVGYSRSTPSSRSIGRRRRADQIGTERGRQGGLASRSASAASTAATRTVHSVTRLGWTMSRARLSGACCAPCGGTGGHQGQSAAMAPSTRHRIRRDMPRTA